MWFKIYCAVVAILLIAFFVIVHSNYQAEIQKSETFNNTERISTGESGSDCEMISVPRSGTTDSWTKFINDEGKDYSLIANIYDLQISNKSAYEMPTWTIKLEISEHCYLNNAWCGTVEIHQFRNGTEKSQLLDLRDYDSSDLQITCLIDGQDLLIPLDAGDYIVYYPAEGINEVPLTAGDTLGDTATIGLIVYHTETEWQVGDYTISYKLYREMLEGETKTKFSILHWVWIIAVVSYLVSIVAYLVAGYRSRKKIEEQKRIIRETMSVFSNFVDAKDSYTQGHSKRVADYSRLLAEKLGKNEEECQHIYYIALLHDCGKCSIPDGILKKPGRLTDEEFEIIKSHTTNGAKMLADFHSIEGIGDGAHYHHERYDGKGYPSGLAGENIPEIGRIICVADSFDAMNSSRCYRPKLTPAIICEELQKCSGTQFDPKMVKAFLELIDDKKIVMQENVENPPEKR